MRIRASHIVVAWILNLSTNVWAGLIAQLPSRVREMVETAVASAPVILIVAWAYPTLRPWFVARSRDLQRFAGFLGILLALGYIVLMLRLKGRSADEIGTSLGLIVLVFALLAYLSKSRVLQAGLKSSELSAS